MRARNSLTAELESLMDVFKTVNSQFSGARLLMASVTISGVQAVSFLEPFWNPGRRASAVELPSAARFLFSA